MSGIDYNEKIPNNVNLAGDRALQRALEQWQPNFVGWWREMGPDGAHHHDVVSAPRESGDVRRERRMSALVPGDLLAIDPDRGAVIDGSKI